MDSGHQWIENKQDGISTAQKSRNLTMLVLEMHIPAIAA
jgi:hypothetical protein